MFPRAPEAMSFLAAVNAAPEEEPAKIPSFLASSRAPPKASSSLILMTWSTSDMSMVSAIKSLPIPSML